MKEPVKTTAPAAPSAAQGLPEIPAALAELYAYSLTTALDLSRGVLEVAGHQHALATRTAREAIGVWEGAGERVLADAARHTAAAAERAGGWLRTRAG